MAGLAHDRYRDRLAALADVSALAPHLDRWLVASGREPGGAWVREYGRFRPGRDPWAVLVLVSGGVGGVVLRVDVHADESATRVDQGADSGLGQVPGVGLLRISEPQDDVSLPGLPAVLRRLDRPRIVRYRPGTRCTLRGLTGAGERFVKITEDGARLDADARRLWAARLDGQLDFDVAEPHGWEDATGSLWFGVVPGRPVVEEITSHCGAAMAGRLGAALGSLAQALLDASDTQPPQVQLERTERAVRRAEKVAPQLSSPLRDTLARLARCHERLRPRPLVPVHGAPHVHQWLQSEEGGLGLIDFDRFALGEPELDLATFLAELDSESELTLPVDELEKAIVTGFESTGETLDPYRLDLYRAHKRVAKVARTACALRPDGDRRAAEHLAALTPELTTLARC